MIETIETPYHALVVAKAVFREARSNMLWLLLSRRRRYQAASTYATVGLTTFVQEIVALTPGNRVLVLIDDGFMTNIALPAVVFVSRIIGFSFYLLLDMKAA